MIRFIFLYIVFCCAIQTSFGQLGLYNNDTLVVEGNTVLFVKGDFTNEHEVFENQGEFTLHGDLVNNTDILNEGTGTLILNGPNTQDINLSGEFKTFNLEIDNADDAVFFGNNNLSVYGDLEFVDGIFYTRNNNLINFKPSSIYFDASDFSHIDGPAIKEGSTAFRFPIGKENRLRPLGISETVFTNSYQAEYFREIAPTLLTDEDLAGVSDFEFWSFDRVAGSNDPKLTLTWDDQSFVNTQQGDLQIGYTPNALPWSRVEATTQLPEQFDTDLTSISAIPGYGNFTFATTNGQTIMQDGVIDFQLEKFKCTVHVKWAANERSERVEKYIVQRRSGFDDFENVFTVDAVNGRSLEDYLFADRDLKENETYQYRIEVHYFDETVVYTDQKFILTSCYPISMTLHPNPAYTDDILTLTVFSEIKENLRIRVVDVLGRVLQTRVLEITPGTSKYIIGDTQHYGAAEYFIWTPEIEEIPTLKFQIIR